MPGGFARGGDVETSIGPIHNKLESPLNGAFIEYLWSLKLSSLSIPIVFGKAQVYTSSETQRQ